MKNWCVVVVILFSFMSYGQYGSKEFYLIDSIKIVNYSEVDKKLLDSCLTLYHESKDDTSKVIAIGEITESLMHNDWVKYNAFLSTYLEKLLDKDLADSERIFYKKLYSGALNNKGIEAINAGNYDVATEFLLQSLELDKELNRKAGGAYTLLNLGFVYENQGMIQKGLQSYAEALTVLEELNDSMGMMGALNNIGYIYDIQKQYDIALEQYQRALEIAKRREINWVIANTMNNIGSVYESTNRLKEGIDFCEKALVIRREIKDMEGVAQSLNNVGSQYEKLYVQRTEKEDTLLYKAIDYYYESLKIREEINDVKLIGHTYNSLSSASFKLGNIEEALEFAKTGLEYAIKMTSPAIERNSSLSLYNIYKKKGEYQQSLSYYENYIVLRDSLVNEKNQKASIRQQTKYEFEKKQLIKEQEDKEMARIKEEQINRRNNLQYSLIFLSILLFFGLVLSLGFIKVSPTIAEGLIFFAFLLLFEFVLVLADPYVDQLTGGEPLYKLLFNAVLAGLIFPLHAFFEATLKTRLIK